MNRKMVAKEILKIAKKITSEQSIWKQPIKIEMKPEGSGIWRIYVQNEDNKYVVYAKMVDEDDFKKKAQPLIDKLIKILESISE